MVSWLPLYHDLGLIGACFTALYVGFPTVVMSPLAFLASRPGRWLRAIDNYRGTVVLAPNFAYDLCLDKVGADELQGLDLSCLRIVLNGAETIQPRTLRGLVERLAPYGLDPGSLVPAYGLAECTVALTCGPLKREPVVDQIDRRSVAYLGLAVPARNGSPTVEVPSCGVPLPGHEVRVVDTRSRELPDRQIGDVQFRGPSATRGYHRNSDAARTLMDGEWLRTGDLGYTVAGELFLTGRSKDLIVKAGRNLSPSDVEEAVSTVEGIRRGCVAVFGTRGGDDTAAPTPDSGERLVVVAESRLQDRGERERLEGAIVAKVMSVAGVPPDDVVLVPIRSVLKTSSGKLRRGEMRVLYERGVVRHGRRPLWHQIARVALSGLIPRCRRVARDGVTALYALYAAVLFASATVALSAAVGVLPGMHRRQRVSQAASRWFLRLAGISRRTSGLGKLPLAKPYVLVVNHCSYIDALVVAAAMPPGVSFVAMSELRRQRVARWLLGRIGVEFVERFDAEQGVQDSRRLLDVLSAGRSLVVFPEGRFTRMPGLLPFRMGAFVTAAKAGACIVPCCLRGTRSLLRGTQWRLLRGPVTLTMGTAIQPEGRTWSDAVRLRDRTRAEMLRRCGEPDLRDERGQAL